jgi:hypothetical protein
MCRIAAWGDPDHIYFRDYLENDVRLMIVTLVENGHPVTHMPILSLAELLSAWEETMRVGYMSR